MREQKRKTQWKNIGYILMVTSATDPETVHRVTENNFKHVSIAQRIVKIFIVW
jgi:hypothetical protein